MVGVGGKKKNSNTGHKQLRELQGDLGEKRQHQEQKSHKNPGGSCPLTYSGIPGIGNYLLAGGGTHGAVHLLVEPSLGVVVFVLVKPDLVVQEVIHSHFPGKRRGENIHKK